MGLSEALVARLRAEILSGAHAPGDQLSEEQIAREHDVSRETVRASLQELVRIGIVDREPYCAATVARPDPRDLEDLLDVRVALEPLLVGRFVQRATDAQLADFERAQARFDLAITQGDPLVIVRRRSAFYEALTEGAGSWALASTIERESARLTLLRTQLLGWPFEFERLRAGTLYRRNIWPMIKRRDAEGAFRACARHLREDSALTIRMARTRTAA
jgi:DNA-binding GntR family transcriptional regulator